MVKFSIIIPARNAESSIEKCLQALHNQTFDDKEIIVVDDASFDATGKIASRYAKVIRSDKRLGVGAARNLAARNASGEILVFTDADCVAPPDWLETIYEDMVSKNVKVWAGGYRDNLEKTFISDFAHLELTYRRRNINGFVMTAVANNLACFRDLFEKFGPFPQDGLASEDIVLTYRLSKEEKIYWNPDNGTLHYHKKDLRSYLKQQFWFSKDTIRRYFQLPRLLFTKTHQGRLLYLEIFLGILLLVSLLFTFLLRDFIFLDVGVASLLIILLLNVGFYTFLRERRGLGFVLKIIPIQIFRDVVCGIGSIFGVFLGILFDLRKTRLES